MREAHKEIQQAFDNITNKTRSAIAILSGIYIRKHKDGKFYLQVDAKTNDGEKVSGFLKYGFTTEQNALDFQRKCHSWLIKLN